MKIDTKTVVKVGVGAFLLYLCIYYWSGVSNFLIAFLQATTPLLVGCLIAYIINLLMSVYESHWFTKSEKKWVIKTRRPFCLILAIVTLLAVIGLILMLVIPQLVSCVKLLFAELPAYIEEWVDWLGKQGILSKETFANLDSIDWKSIIGQVFTTVSSGLGNIVSTVVGVVSSVVGGLISTFFCIMFAVYLLLGKDKLGRQATGIMKKYMPEKRYTKVKHVIDVFNNSFRGYIIGQSTEAVILGVLCALGMWILQMPYAAMVGTLIAFTALVPIAGAYIGGAIGAFMIFTVSPIKAVIFVIFLVILQQIEGNLIYPKVVGTSIGLPGIWVLAAVTIGGGIAGIAGMFIGVPLAAALYKLLREKIRKDRKTEDSGEVAAETAE